MSGGFTAPAYRSADLVHSQPRLFERAGLQPDMSGTVAEVLVEGDLLVHSTHGLALAAPYLPALADGGMAHEGAPAVVSGHDGATCWDGRRLRGLWPVVEAIEQALARVPSYRIAAVTIRESHHVGCLAAYLERATARGCMILLTCSDPSEGSVAPFSWLRRCSRPTRSRSASTAADPTSDRHERVDHQQRHDRRAA
jgi:LDH2 family malate/lactate/ureidoglycolate dehydrogenase